MKLASVLLLLTILLVFYSISNVSPEIRLLGDNSPEKTGTSNTSTVSIAGVDNQGKGVMAKIRVTVEQGTGEVLIDINDVLFLADTQQSIRIARSVSEALTKKTGVNYIYEIKEVSAVAGGPSAGLPLTVATMAALENKTIPEWVLMTGTIDQNGNVGRVGGVPEKTKAAKEKGFKRVIVPRGQAVFQSTEKKTICDTVCSDFYVQTTRNLNEIGIEVIEVGNIEEALKYVFN